MSLSASRRTWDEAVSPAAVRLARAYEQAWYEAEHRGRRLDPLAFLEAAGASMEGPGARLAVLRADLSLRWEAGERPDARWYLNRHVDLSEDTIVALVYEEFCLREEEGENPDPTFFLEEYPEVALALRRVLDIHGLVGSGSTHGGSILSSSGSGEHACPFPEAGQTIAGFYLVEELGRGSFARVFLARERDLANRPVAVKVTRRGSREPQTLARLQHTHIVPVHSHRLDKATGLHLLCMPFFGRTTLTRVLLEAREAGDRSGAGLVAALDRLEPKEVPTGPTFGRVAIAGRSYDLAIAWWGARLAEGLAHAHERKVLHRDIKPSNVLVTADGLPMLLDFNLAHEPVDEPGAEEDAAPGGTVDYMAPEHLLALCEGESDAPDRRSDIYSLGVVLHEALTGCRPFPTPRRGSSLVEALHRAAEDRRGARPHPAAIEPTVPPALDAVVARCLEPDPADRYQGAAELAADLRAVADDLPLSYAREPLPSRVGGWLRRKRLKLMVYSAIITLLLITTTTILAARIGFLLVLEQRGRLAEWYFEEGEKALEAREYEKSHLYFKASGDLTDPAIDYRQGGGLLQTGRTIVHRLRNLGKVPDLAELRHDAQINEAKSANFAESYKQADELHRAADRLRFEILLEIEDLPTIWSDLEKAVHPFYVLRTRHDWSQLPRPLGDLNEARRRQVIDEVEELLFLWVQAVERLARKGAAAADDRDRDLARKIGARAMEICNRVGRSAGARGPWQALRARLLQTIGGEKSVPPGTSSAEKMPRSALSAFEWAVLHLGDGQTALAIDRMQEAVRLRPDDYWYQYSLAYMEDLAGHPDAAMVHYSIAAAKQQDNPYVRYSRGRLYRSRGKWEDARADFDAALAGLRNRPQARMVLLERAVLAQASGDIPAALEDYDAVILGGRDDDNGRSARINRADILADRGDLVDARAEFDALIAEDESDRVARQSRAQLELRMGEALGADADLTALLNRPGLPIRDRVDYLAQRAQARLLDARAAEALADAVEAQQVSRSPALDRLVHRAAMAARLYDDLALERPEDLALWPLQGRQLAAELRTAAAALAPIAAGRDGRAFRAGLNRAVILAAIGRPREAIASAGRSVALSPYSVDARLIRARVLRSAGDRASGEAEVEYALTIHPDQPQLHELRGLLRLDAGDPAGAIENLNRAIALNARDRVHVEKADALLALGRPRAALEEWSLALRIDPEWPEAYLGRARTSFLLGAWDQGLADLEQAAAWAHADPRIEAAVAIGYLRALRARPKRLPRLLAHTRRAMAGFRRTVEKGRG